MTAALSFIFLVPIPLMLASGIRLDFSLRTRRTMLVVCGLLSAAAALCWFFERGKLIFALLFLVPIYQVRLYDFICRDFKANHGRELELIAFGIITDSDRRKDASYSTAYFAGALGLPLLLLAIPA